MHTPAYPLRWLMLAALLLLLMACATQPPPVVVPPPTIQPLPQAARQPPVPAICSPTCSAALEIELRRLQRKLTGAE